MRFHSFRVIIGGIVKIAVNWFLVADPGINILGAPIGTLSCYAVMCVMDYIFLCRVMPDRPKLGRILARLLPSLTGDIILELEIQSGDGILRCGKRKWREGKIYGCREK